MVVGGAGAAASISNGNVDLSSLSETELIVIVALYVLMFCVSTGCLISLFYGDKIKNYLKRNKQQ